MAHLKRQTAFRLSDIDDKLLTALTKKKGVNKTAIVVLALREMAEREGIALPAEEEPERAQAALTG